MKERLDKIMVERGLVESRARAQALILAGQVLVREQRIDKPGQSVDMAVSFFVDPAFATDEDTKGLSEMTLSYAFYPAEPAVPTHGTFNPEQILIDGERIGFIDFDDYCMAEPALDVGLFRSAIKDTGMNAPFATSSPSRAERLARLSLLDKSGDAFLSEYETHAAISRNRVALWEAADYLRNCLHYWIKVKPEEPDNALLILDQLLQNCEKNHLLEGA